MKGVNKKNIIRLVGVILLIVAAVCVAFILMPKLYKMEGATTNIVMLRQDVEIGTIIDSSMLATVTVGSYGMDATVIKNADDIIGKYAAENISYKDLLFPEKFVETDPLINEPPAPPEIELADDQMLVTLALSSTAAGAAGNILPGDLVNVAVFIEENSSNNGGYGTIIDDAEELLGEDNIIFPTELQEMTVYRVLTSELTFVNPNPEDSSSSNSRIPVYITLICTQPQADMLLEYSYENVVHFVEVE